MDSTVLLSLIGLGEAIITSVVTFLLTRRKYKTEVKGGEIENQGNQIDNDRKDLQFYIDMVEDNKAQLAELQKENREQRREIAEMRSVVFSMLQQICTDMMCQSRQFDREKCPYYDQIFKEIKADREHMEIEEE